MADSKQRDPRRWRALYRAAISETNRTLIPSRLAEAEETVRARASEVSQKTGWTVQDEKEALDDALYTLEALRESLGHVSPAA